MKMNRITKHVSGLLLAAAVAVGVCACSEEPMKLAFGSLPSQDGERATPVISLKSRNQANGSNLVKKTFIMPNVSDAIYFKLDIPATEKVSVKATVAEDAEALVAAYNEKNGTFFTPCPPENATFPKGDELAVEPGKLTSNTTFVSISIENLDMNVYYGGNGYLLPVTYTTLNGISEGDPKSAIVFYELWGNYMTNEDMGLGELGEKDFTVVTYVNTEKIIPELATQYYVDVTSLETWETESKRWYDIVNLNVSQIRYSTTERRSILYLNPDISYVLEHSEKYIAPCQKFGQKVCLVIKGGNTGLGFSNLTDIQISDFAAQVKVVVEKANLDGVNLWDEGAGYGKEGMPVVNTTSYAKLIKALDEAMPDKIISLVDLGEPFDVVQAGVTVGNHLDYAWNMDFSEFIDPWDADAKRKPILGLQKQEYGGFVANIYDRNNYTFELQNFLTTGPDKIFVISEIIRFTQGWESADYNSSNFIVNAKYTHSEDWSSGYMGFLSLFPSWDIGGYSDSIWDKDW
jgi:hypothetical protein